MDLRCMHKQSVGVPRHGAALPVIVVPGKLESGRVDVVTIVNVIVVRLRAVRDEFAICYSDEFDGWCLRKLSRQFQHLVGETV
jgi:hypothetical protein